MLIQRKALGYRSLGLTESPVWKSDKCKHGMVADIDIATRARMILRRGI